MPHPAAGQRRVDQRQDGADHGDSDGGPPSWDPEHDGEHRCGQARREPGARRLLDILETRNQSRHAFQVTSDYVVAVAQRETQRP